MQAEGGFIGDYPCAKGRGAHARKGTDSQARWFVRPDKSRNSALFRPDATPSEGGRVHGQAPRLAEYTAHGVRAAHTTGVVPRTTNGAVHNTGKNRYRFMNQLDERARARSWLLARAERARTCPWNAAEAHTDKREHAWVGGRKRMYPRVSAAHAEHFAGKSRNARRTLA